MTYVFRGKLYCDSCGMALAEDIVSGPVPEYYRDIYSDGDPKEGSVVRCSSGWHCIDADVDDDGELLGCVICRPISDDYDLQDLHGEVRDEQPTNAKDEFAECFNQYLEEAGDQ